MPARRTFLGLVAAAASLSGCTSGDDSGAEQADIIAGPESRLTFDPKTLTIHAGQQVTWFFDSSGHNVSAVPGDSDLVSIPDRAAPFSSYDAAKHRTVQRGETFSHRFDVVGTYEYVCIPHQSAGMVGSIEVE